MREMWFQKYLTTRYTSLLMRTQQNRIDISKKKIHLNKYQYTVSAFNIKQIKLNFKEMFLHFKKFYKEIYFQFIEGMYVCMYVCLAHF